MLSESVKSEFVESICSGDNDNVFHHLSDGDSAHSHALFCLLVCEFPEKAIDLMRSSCFELFPVALKSCNCAHFDTEMETWEHAERVCSLVNDALSTEDLSDASLSPKELHLVCIDHFVVHFVVPGERAESLHLTVCLRFRLLCGWVFPALLRLKPTGANGESPDLAATYARKYSQTLRAVVALLTELVSLIAQAEHERPSSAMDGPMDPEGPNESCILSLLITAVEVLHRFTLGSLSPAGSGGREPRYYGLDMGTSYARIYTCVAGFSGGGTPIPAGILLDPSVLLAEEHRMQQSVASTGYLLSVVLLLASNMFLFPLNSECVGAETESPRGDTGLCAEVFKALLVYALRYQDCCGSFSWAVPPVNAGVSVQDVLLHPFRCRGFLVRHYSAARAAWLTGNSDEAGECSSGQAAGVSAGVSQSGDKPWYKTLSEKERKASCAYFHRVHGVTGRSVLATQSMVPWSLVCNDSLLNQVRDRVNECCGPLRFSQHDALAVPALGSAQSRSLPPQYSVELVHGLNWNCFAVAALTAALLDPSLLVLRTPQCGLMTSLGSGGEISLPLPVPFGVYSMQHLFELSLPAFVTLLSKATTASSDCLRSNCMALALRLGGARYDLGHCTRAAKDVGSSIDRSMRSMTQALRDYHGDSGCRPAEFAFVPRSLGSTGRLSRPGAELPVQVPLLERTDDRAVNVQAMSLCKLQASSCDAFGIAVGLCTLMSTLSSSVVNMTVVGAGSPGSLGIKEPTAGAAAVGQDADSNGNWSAPQVHMLLKKFLCTLEPGSMMLLLRALTSSELGWDALGGTGDRAFAAGLLVDMAKGLCQYQWSLRTSARNAHSLPFPVLGTAGVELGDSSTPLLPPAPPTTVIHSVWKEGRGGSVGEDCEFLVDGADSSYLDAGCIDAILKWFVVAVCSRKHKELDGFVAGSAAVRQIFSDESQADFISALSLASSLAVYMTNNPIAIQDDRKWRIQGRFSQVREQLHAIMGLINAKSCGLGENLPGSILQFNIAGVIDRCSLIADNFA